MGRLLIKLLHWCWRSRRVQYITRNVSESIASHLVAHPAGIQIVRFDVVVVNKTSPANWLLLFLLHCVRRNLERLILYIEQSSLRIIASKAWDTSLFLPEGQHLLIILRVALRILLGHLYEEKLSKSVRWCRKQVRKCVTYRKPIVCPHLLSLMHLVSLSLSCHNQFQCLSSVC